MNCNKCGTEMRESVDYMEMGNKVVKVIIHVCPKCFNTEEEFF